MVSPSQIRSVPADALVGDLIPSDHPLFGIIWINPERLGGTPCFYASRVPVKNLFDYLAGGETLDQFLDDFEGVTRERVNAVLQLARHLKNFNALCIEGIRIE